MCLPHCGVGRKTVLRKVGISAQQPVSRKRRYRTPVSTVFENLQDMSVDELVEEFGVTREQVQAVLQFAAHTAEVAAPRP